MGCDVLSNLAPDFPYRAWRARSAPSWDDVWHGSPPRQLRRLRIRAGTSSERGLGHSSRTTSRSRRTDAATAAGRSCAATTAVPGGTGAPTSRSIAPTPIPPRQPRQHGRAPAPTPTRLRPRARNALRPATAAHLRQGPWPYFAAASSSGDVLWGRPCREIPARRAGVIGSRRRRGPCRAGHVPSRRPSRRLVRAVAHVELGALPVSSRTGRIGAADASNDRPRRWPARAAPAPVASGRCVAGQ